MFFWFYHLSNVTMLGKLLTAEIVKGIQKDKYDGQIEVGVLHPVHFIVFVHSGTTSCLCGRFFSCLWKMERISNLFGLFLG